MDSFANYQFTCYCQTTVQGTDLRSHFDACPCRDSSPIHTYVASSLQTYQGTCDGFCYAMELYWEADQLLKRPNPPNPPQPIVSFRKCSKCPQSNIEGGKRYSDCEHIYCKEHRPAGLCPECHPEVQVKCDYCAQPSETFIVLECTHTFCHTHIQEIFPLVFVPTGELPCFRCNRPMLHPELKMVMGEQAVESALLKLALPEWYNLVRCPKCKLEGGLEPSEVDYSMKDLTGRLYSRPAAEEYCKYRFRCPRCNTTLCANCNKSPYHDSLTCEQWARLANGTCRCCEELPPVAEDCCEKPECQLVLQSSCRKILPCGHRCYGIAGEFYCPPCLVANCCPDQKATENDYYCVCGSEKLRNGPVLELECGHFLHYRCLKEALWKRWSGTRITFKFCRCPLCQEWAVPKTNEELQREIGKYQQLYEEIKSRGLELLRREPEENKRINDPSDRDYFNQPERYVLDRFCFYECSSCHNPYFGGKKECGDNSDQMRDPNELKCPNCIPGNAGQPGRKCQLHGSDFTAYKCKFCCSVALYFCWGTTHFCESCHKRHHEGDYMTDKKPHQLPQCPGPTQCPLGIQHPPNGTEFILGCSLCR